MSEVRFNSGERLFDKLGAANLQLEQVRAIGAPGVSHIRYHLGR
jgi:hypothetical protein